MKYGGIDFQLLFELRAASLSERLIPVALMRVFRARGWVVEGDTRIDVQGHTGAERMPICDCTLTTFRLTRVGFRELISFDLLLDEVTLDEDECRILDESDRGWDDFEDDYPDDEDG